MPTKSKEARKKQPNPALDLFGEVPVLVSDLHAWVFWAAPRWYGTRRMDYYIREWNIADKVRSAKLRGGFNEVLDSYPYRA